VIEPPRHRFIESNGIRLHVVEQGDGPLIVLLHGFPEFWYSWRNQIGPLAVAGFRVVASDMRGYGKSDKPAGISSYDIDTLADDVAGLIRALGYESAVVVGHDWGGAVAWATAIRHPLLVSRLIILNAPHPGAMRRAILTLQQLRKSWYILAFQLPWLPEAVIRFRDFRLIRQLFRDEPRRAGAFTVEDIDLYIEAMREPGALTAMLNYYRAAPGSVRHRIARTENVVMPTLVLWGTDDKYLGPELLEGLERWVSDLRVRRFPDTTHWIQHDKPDVVTAAILEFLAEQRG
jgi:pimeloyl-ACP methyl ester carboxylesterase